MADFSIKRGDRLPEIQVTLLDAAGDEVPLTSATVRFIMTLKASNEVVVDESATVVDAPNGVVKYSWAEGDTDLAGKYKAEWEVTFPGDLSETFPNDSYLEVQIFADLGGVNPDA